MADFRVTVTHPARRDLARLPRKEQLKIAERIKSLQTSPFPRGNTIKKIQGTDLALYRLRVGNYRVIYVLEGSEVIIQHIVHRQSLEQAIRSMR